jgi:CspA family cold shock protein
MANGTIKFFNANKGFGFVTPDGGGADIFLPAATLTTSGVAKVLPGQRVAFEQSPDKKGPKVVALQLLGAPIAKAPTSTAQRVTVYCDPSSDVVADVLQVVHNGGFQLQLIDYTVASPGPDQLRHLSHLLSGSGESLVRRHDPLFSALQLDDRFIGDQEFWTAIAEHPALINGPVLALAGKARVCKSREDANVFLNNGGNSVTTKPKFLSPRMVALMRGETAVTATADTAVQDSTSAAKTANASALHKETETNLESPTQRQPSPSKSRTKLSGPRIPDKAKNKPAGKARVAAKMTKQVRKPVKKPKK